MSITKEINTRIKNKIDDLGAWTSTEEILLDGEIALIRVNTTITDPATGDTVTVPVMLMKVGDGESPFSKLPWLSAKAADVSDWAKVSHAEDIDIQVSTGSDEASEVVTQTLSTWIASLLESDKLHNNEIIALKDKNITVKNIEDALGYTPASSEELPSAIEAAFEQAKENGDFKGDPGEKGDKGDKGDRGEQGIQGIQGEKGADGQKGADGVPCTHSWNGTTLTVTSASGTSSANLKGEKGSDGISCSHTWNGTTLTITSDSGTSSADLKGATGERGEKGDRGDSGVYIGSGEMPEGYNIQLDPNGAVFDMDMIPVHYNQWKYYYVDCDNGDDSNDGTSPEQPFKTIERAFKLANEGHVDLRIKVLSAGIYTFERSTFTAMALHIYNMSSGEVILKRIKSGVTAFYQCHLNFKGISWEGYICETDGCKHSSCSTENDTYGSKQYDRLYFEGCTTFVTDTYTEDNKTYSHSVSVYPTIKTFGGFIEVECIGTEVVCGGIDLRNTTAVLDDITIKPNSCVLDTTKIDSKTNFGILAIMSTITFKNNFTLNLTCDELASLMSEKGRDFSLYYIGRCVLYFDDNFCQCDSGVIPDYVVDSKISRCYIYGNETLRGTLQENSNVQLENNIWPYKTKKFTRNTNSNGNVFLDLYEKDAVLIQSVTAQTADSKKFICTPFLIDNGDWYANITTVADKTNVTDTIVEITVTYTYKN